MRKFSLLLLVAALILGFASMGHARAQTVELRMIWYNDGNEGEVLRGLLDKFEADHSGIKVVIETVPFKDLPTVMQTQLESNNPPDMARLTDVPRYRGKYLDLRPLLKDAELFESSFPAEVLATYRSGSEDKGLYGYPTQFTVTGPLINATLFAQAGVDIPTGDTTLAEWVELAKQVKEATGVPYAVAIDRSLHRITGPSLSLGGQWVDKETGKITFDNPATREFLDMLKSWHDEDITPKNIWIAENDKYAAGRDYFVNGELVFYYSGSWQVGGFANDIGDKFDWRAVPMPCGPGGCTGMPGGASVMAFGGTKHPEAVAMVMEYLSSEAVYGEFAAKTLFLPGHLGLIAKGVDYPTQKDNLNVFASSIPKLSEQGYLFQQSSLTGPMNEELRIRIGQALVGEITMDEAVKAVQKVADDACAAEPAKCPPFN
ncbi:MAG TPA: sugar ABC transporter substrate-binding protein [Aggregatilineales bacterium]|nr:sugar ABC transporter substrate-binding protein [Anaerolineales bacterium]HRE48435.1 sugar ABC transporter substrate-binding protein [Aggregatilineales bacterium]